MSSGRVFKEVSDAAGLVRTGPRELRRSECRRLLEWSGRRSAALVKGELQPGERVLWAGRSRPPWQGPGLGSFLVGAIALICLGFGAVNLAYAFGRPRFHPDEGSFVVGSISCMIGSFFALGLIASTLNLRAVRRQSASVCYAVTEQRVIVWAPEAKLNSVRVHTIPRDKSAISCGSSVPMAPEISSFPAPVRTAIITFVRRVSGTYPRSDGSSRLFVRT